MGAAFGMSGPTLSGSKRDDSKTEERKHAPTQETGASKVLAGKKATQMWSTLPGTVKKIQEGGFMGRQGRFQSLSPSMSDKMDGKNMKSYTKFRSMSHDDDEINAFMANAQELGMFNIFYNMPKKNVGEIRKQITKKTNIIVNKNREKQQQLKDLYTQLEHL